MLKNHRVPQRQTPKPSTPKKSTNTNLKELKIAGYELINDGGNYSLTVNKDIDKINVIANVEDSKAKVTGAGNQALNIGENKINVVVTAESGATKTYIITVIRRDSYSLNELEEELKKQHVMK